MHLFECSLYHQTDSHAMPAACRFDSYFYVSSFLQTCNWSIGRIPKDKSPALSGNLVLESGLDRLHVFPVFKVGFKIMGVALSGLQIDKLDIKNTPSHPYKGFRALTQSGEYEVRS